MPLCTARRVPPPWLTWPTHPHAQPLNDQQTRAMIDGIADSAMLTADVVNAVVDRTDGVRSSPKN